MGIFIEENGKKRELVKVKSDNTSHDGYYTTYRDMMKPGDVEFEVNPVKETEPEKKPSTFKKAKRK